MPNAYSFMDDNQIQKTASWAWKNPAQKSYEFKPKLEQLALAVMRKCHMNRKPPSREVVNRAFEIAAERMKR